MTDQIGALLKRSRKALGHTQRELAHRAGVSERLWAEVERGERPNVSLDTALRMLNLVGVSIRLDDPQGSHHVLKVSDPAGATDARAARAAMRRATWKGLQTRLGEEGDNSIAALHPAQNLNAVAQVSEQAYGVARASRARDIG